MSPHSFHWPSLLEALLVGKDLNSVEAKALMNAWLKQELTEVQTGAFLAGLRSKGCSGIELSSMAEVLREACSLPVSIPSLFMVDTCGTGGDGADTFNISTAVSFLAASCGVTIAKHGNRSASGKVGSADVLEGLGIRLDAPLDRVVDAISKEKICFLFAPAWHPSLKNLGPLRKSLGVRTIFNLLGPLVNPLRPKAQVLGVAKHELLDPMSEALKTIGLERAVVVYGSGGLDEASIAGPNHVRFLEHGKLTSEVLDPSDFGISLISNEELKGGDLKHNMDILSSLLKGGGPIHHKQVVALNNSLVLWAAGLETDLNIGFKKSMSTLDSGEPWNVLQNLSTFLND